MASKYRPCSCTTCGTTFTAPYAMTVCGDCKLAAHKLRADQARAQVVNLLARQVRPIRNGWEVPSATSAGVVYTVQDLGASLACDCPAGQNGVPFKHLSAVAAFSRRQHVRAAA